MRFDYYIESLLGKPLDLNLILIILLIIFILEIMIWICFYYIKVCYEKTKSEMDELKSEIRRLNYVFNDNLSNYVDFKQNTKDNHDNMINFIKDNRDEMLYLNNDSNKKINSLKDSVSQSFDIMKALVKRINESNSKYNCENINLNNQISSLNEKVEQLSFTLTKMSPEQQLIDKKNKIIEEIRSITEFLFSVVENDYSILHQIFTTYVRIMYNFYDETKMVGKNFFTILEKYFSLSGDKIDSQVCKLFEVFKLSQIFLLDYDVARFFILHPSGDFVENIKYIKSRSINQLLSNKQYPTANPQCCNRSKMFINISNNSIQMLNESDLEFEIRMLNIFLELIRKVYVFVKTLTEIKENTKTDA